MRRQHADAEGYTDHHLDHVTRRGLLKAGASLATGAALAQLGSPALAADVRKPNILFLMDDQHRGDALGIAGNKVIQTPNLDRLARDGAYFPKAYSSIPSCPGARASILTGLSPWNHGLLGYAAQAKHWPFVLPRAMDDAGYQTHVTGKNHFNPWRNTNGYQSEEIYDGLPVTDGVDDYGQWLKKTAPGVKEHANKQGWNDRNGMPWPHDVALHPTAWVGQRAVDFITGFASDRPFFLKVSFHRPHSPFDPPKHWWEQYANAEFPAVQVGAWAEKWFGSFTPPQPVTAPRANLPAADVHNMRQGYYGAISFVDEQIGRIVDALRTRKVWDNTLILFVADHGEMAGDQHLWRKTYAYEPSSRIPMIVRWGDSVLQAPRGQVLHQLTELRDVLPTCLDAAGASAPRKLDGRSLLDPIRGTAEGWRTQLDMEHSACFWKESSWTALTDGTFKYIFHTNIGAQQLFNFVDDPAELHDLSNDPEHAKTVQEWRQKMIAHLSERGDQWVANGDLVTSNRILHYGPNFPKQPVTAEKDNTA